MITRFSVPNLHKVTIHLTNVVNGKSKPDQILTNAKILSTYSERIIENKEIWISKGRIACIKDTGTSLKIFNMLDIKLDYINFEMEKSISITGNKLKQVNHLFSRVQNDN